MTLTQKELEVNAALQKTGIEKYTEALRELAALLHVELDLESPYWGGLKLQIELGKVFANLIAARRDCVEPFKKRDLTIDWSDSTFHFRIPDGGYHKFDYVSYGEAIRVTLVRPQFTFPDYWMKASADAIVGYITEHLRDINALRRLVIMSRDITSEHVSKSEAESLARAQKAMAQLELLRRL